MITAKEANDIARPKRDKIIREELEEVLSDVKESAHNGNMSVLIGYKLEWEVETTLTIKGKFKVFYDEGTGKTTISWI